MGQRCACCYTNCYTDTLCCTPSTEHTVVLSDPPPCSLRVTVFQRGKGERVAIGYDWLVMHLATIHHHLSSTAAVDILPSMLHTAAPPIATRLEPQGPQTASACTITLTLGPAQAAADFAQDVLQRLLGLGDVHHTCAIDQAAFLELMEVCRGFSIVYIAMCCVGRACADL